MHRISARTAVLLTIPPLLWAGNAVAGRMAVGVVSPLLLSAIRWVLAMIILLPLGWRILRPSSMLWARWQYFAFIGFLGVGCYNSLQYLALQISSPLNVTLIAASMPVWMLVIGALFYGEKPRQAQILGALLSIAGVLLVLSRGQWAMLMQVRLVSGDFLMLLATIIWALYSWILVRPDPKAAAVKQWPWVDFLIAQIALGSVGCVFAAAGEWTMGYGHIEWSARMVALSLFVAIGPGLIAFRCWGAGVAITGPTVAAFFSNLTPLFTALLSAIVLNILPEWYHALAFVLIVAGIVVSSKRC